MLRLLLLKNISLATYILLQKISWQLIILTQFKKYFEPKKRKKKLFSNIKRYKVEAIIGSAHVFGNTYA